jgi:hypothetical protein
MDLVQIHVCVYCSCMDGIDEAMKTMAMKTMAMKTMAMKTMAMKTMAMKTMAMKSMAMKMRIEYDWETMAAGWQLEKRLRKLKPGQCQCHPGLRQYHPNPKRHMLIREQMLHLKGI